MKRWIALFFCVAANGASAMSLEEAIMTAIATNPEILDAYAQFESALEDRKYARGDYLPTVSLTAGIGPEHTDYRFGSPIDSELTRSELGLRISQLLFDGFKTGSEIDRLENEAESTRLALVALAENIALEVTRTYIALIKAERIRGIADQQVIEHLQTLADIEDRVNTGFSSDADLAQVRARLASSRAALVNASNALHDEHASFLRLVGQPAGDLVEPASIDSLLAPTIEGTLEQAVNSHPQILSAIADTEAAAEEHRASKGSLWPELRLEAEFYENDDIGGFPGPEENGRVMLRMQWDLYDGGKRGARTDSSEWRYESAMSIRRSTERQVIEGARFAWNAKEFLREQELVYAENVSASEEAERGYEQQFRIGQRTLLDLLDARVEVFLAERNYINAYLDRLLAEYRVANSTGRLINSLRIAYPEEWQSEGAP